MRTSGLLLIVTIAAACKQRAATPAGGSATPPETPSPAGAHPNAPLDAAVAVAIDAAPAADAPTTLVIASEGVGPIHTGIDTSKLPSMFPGLEVATEHDEGEDHNYDTVTLSKDKHRVLDVVIDNMAEKPELFRVDVYDGSLATAAGARVTSTVQDIAALYPDLTCKYEHYDDGNAEGWNVALFCTSASLPAVSFQLDPAKFRGKDGKVPVARIATRTFQRSSGSRDHGLWVFRSRPSCARSLAPGAIAKW